MDARETQNRQYLRLYYAGRVITGLVRGRSFDERSQPNASQFAHMAFEVANAMVAEAEKHRT
jgi:hypothetical protein